MNDKKTLIYNAVISLIQESGFHSNIKISDIAKKAGIGKGTVYEYFSNKEEIIKNSIIFFMKGKFQYILEDSSDLSFELRTKNLIRRVFKIFNENQNFHGLFISQNIGSMLSNEKKLEIRDEIFKLKKDINILIRDIITKGKEEKVISKDIDDFNIMVLKTTIMSSTIEYICMKEDNIDEDEFVDKLYSIIIKIL